MIRRSSRSRAVRLSLVGLLLGSVVAAISLYLGVGPTDEVPCSEQSRFERGFYGDRLGAVDGADYSGCVVPTGAAYAIAAFAGLSLWIAFTAAGCRVLGRSPRDRSTGAAH